MSLLFKTVNAAPSDYEFSLGAKFFNYNTTITLTDVFQNTTRFLFGIAYFFVILFFAISAVLFITSAGDKAKLDTAKNSLKYTVIAFLILGGLNLLILYLSQLFGGGVTGLVDFSLTPTTIRN